MKLLPNKCRNPPLRKRKKKQTSSPFSPLPPAAIDQRMTASLPPSSLPSLHVLTIPLSLSLLAPLSIDIGTRDDDGDSANTTGSDEERKRERNKRVSSPGPESLISQSVLFSLSLLLRPAILSRIHLLPLFSSSSSNVPFFLFFCYCPPHFLSPSDSRYRLPPFTGPIRFIRPYYNNAFTQKSENAKADESCLCFSSFCQPRLSLIFS